MTDWSCCSALTIDYLNLTNDCLTLLNWTDWLTDPAELTDWSCVLRCLIVIPSSVFVIMALDWQSCPNARDAIASKNDSGISPNWTKK